MLPIARFQPAAAVSLLARRHHTLTRGFPLAVAPHLAFAAARPLLSVESASLPVDQPPAAVGTRTVIVRVPAMTDPMLLRTATLLAGACGLDHVYGSLALQYARVCEDAALGAVHNLLLAAVSEVELSRLAGSVVDHVSAIRLSPAFHVTLRALELKYEGSLVYEASRAQDDDGIAFEAAFGSGYEDPSSAAELHAARLRVGLAQEAASIYAHHAVNRDECRVRGALLSLRAAIARWLFDRTWMHTAQDGSACADEREQSDARLVAAFAAVDPHTRVLLCSSVSSAGGAAASSDPMQSALAVPEIDMLVRVAAALSRVVFATAPHDDAAMAAAFADWSAALGMCAAHGLVGAVPVLARLLTVAVEMSPLDSAERVAAVTGTNWTCFVDALNALAHAGKSLLMTKPADHADTEPSHVSVTAIQAWSNSLLRSPGAARAWNAIALFERKRRLAAQLGASSPSSSSAQQTPSEADLLLHAQPPPALDAPSPGDAVAILLALTWQCHRDETAALALVRDALLEWATARSFNIDSGVAFAGNADATRAVCVNAWAQLQARNPLFGNP